MHDRTFEDNREAIEAWNTVLFDKFVRFREVLTRGLGAHGDALLERHPVREGSRVLDVGCGFGDTTLRIARAAGARGSCTGVDAAARFIEVARREGEGVNNAHFSVADVETDTLGGTYDRAFSRFGTMFFAAPVRALKSVRRSLTPGGELTIVVWRRKDENPLFYDPEQRVLELVQVPEKTDEPTCGPGPFSQASPDVLSAQLRAAGFDRITFERFDADVRVGANVELAVEFAMALGPAGEVMRLAGEEGLRRKPEVVASLRTLLEPLSRPEGVYAASSSWLVSARAC
ncbi:MAG: class I SAM-dependent methyltransferase [Polyangiaceae bacterium]|jgi:ubiquinone/menaquinone biosynthesis C-methylase UbiE